MAKSPISVLQELSIKQGYVPIYNYTGIRTNGTYDQFVCRVDCKTFNTEGVANTKKEAKQNAAMNMLRLLGMENETSALSPNNNIANKVQISTPTKIQEPISLSRMETPPSSPNHINYVGALQEFCVRQELSYQDIAYKVIDESGPPHMKNFTVEVSIGSKCERGSAKCKKTAKQVAAKKLLEHLHPDLNKLLEKKENGPVLKETLEEAIRKSGVGISECVISKPSTTSQAKLSKKAQALFVKCTNKEIKVTREDSLLKNLHNLFEKTYSHKISYEMRRKLQSVRDVHVNDTGIIERIVYTHASIIERIMQDIVKTLNVKMEKTFLPCLTEQYIIRLRLSTIPVITQFGMGATKDMAEIQAKYNIIETILTFLNI